MIKIFGVFTLVFSFQLVVFADKLSPEERNAAITYQRMMVQGSNLIKSELIERKEPVQLIKKTQIELVPKWEKQRKLLLKSEVPSQGILTGAAWLYWLECQNGLNSGTSLFSEKEKVVVVKYLKGRWADPEFSAGEDASSVGNIIRALKSKDSVKRRKVAFRISYDLSLVLSSLHGEKDYFNNPRPKAPKASSRPRLN